MQDFSPADIDDDLPEIVDNADGTQVLQYQGMALDLPDSSKWCLERFADGEIYVTAHGRNPKSVKGLMKLKRVRKFLG